MTTRGIPEADWKVFRNLRQVALGRYCSRVLDAAEAITRNASRTPHQRYLSLFDLIQKKDRELADAFDDFGRSTALLQLAVIRSLGMINDEQMMSFSHETQDAVVRISGPTR